MTISQNDFNALRAKQAELTALADQDAEHAKQLGDAEAKSLQLTNRLAQALADPRSNWASVDALQRDLALTELQIAQLTSMTDDERTAKVSDLLHDVAQAVSIMAGKGDPFADPLEPQVLEAEVLADVLEIQDGVLQAVEGGA